MYKTTHSVVIYHNPNCSKSRETLAILKSRHINAEVIHYLETPPTVAQLTTILNKLGFHSARQLIRNQEACYETLNLANPNLSEADLLAAMCDNPILIERPIVMTDIAARIGRPPESVLDIL